MRCLAALYSASASSSAPCKMPELIEHDSALEIRDLRDAAEAVHDLRDPKPLFRPLHAQEKGGGLLDWKARGELALRNRNHFPSYDSDCRIALTLETSAAIRLYPAAGGSCRTATHEQYSPRLRSQHNLNPSVDSRFTRASQPPELGGKARNLGVNGVLLGLGGRSAHAVRARLRCLRLLRALCATPSPRHYTAAAKTYRSRYQDDSEPLHRR